MSSWAYVFIVQASWIVGVILSSIYKSDILFTGYIFGVYSNFETRLLPEIQGDLSTSPLKLSSTKPNHLFGPR